MPYKSLLLRLSVAVTLTVLSGCKEEKAWTHDCSEVATYSASEWSYDTRSFDTGSFGSIKVIGWGEISRPKKAYGISNKYYDFKKKDPKVKRSNFDDYDISDINRVLTFLNIKPITSLDKVPAMYSRDTYYLAKYGDGILHIHFTDWDRHPMTGAQMTQYEPGCSSISQIQIEQFVQ